MIDYIVNKVQKCVDIYDPKQRIYIFFDIFFEIFRVVMACGLGFFVPQRCYGPSGCEDVSDNPHICSIYANSNVYCLDSYNLFVLSFNIFTAICFSILYFVEIKRDQWLMKHFIMNHKEINSNLNKYKNIYPLLFRKLHNYNRIYFISYQIIALIYIINTILSVVLFYFNFFDATTVTVVLTNTLLCSRKFYNGIYVSYTSLVTNFPICYYSKQFVSFNAIDFKKISRRNSELLTNVIDVRRFEVEDDINIDIGPFLSIKRILKRCDSLKKVSLNRIHVSMHDNSGKGCEELNPIEEYKIEDISEQLKNSDYIHDLP
jgi:hypothetical protein